MNNLVNSEPRIERSMNSFASRSCVGQVVRGVDHDEVEPGLPAEAAARVVKQSRRPRVLEPAGAAPDPVRAVGDEELGVKAVGEADGERVEDGGRLGGDSIVTSFCRILTKYKIKFAWLLRT